MFNPVDAAFPHLTDIERAALKRRRARTITILSALLALVILGGMVLQVLS